MSKVVSLRLRQSQMDQLHRLARRLGRSPSETGALLIEEALRMTEFGHITFRDSPAGRQAYVAGTGLAVWEVIWLLRAHEDDMARTADYLDWPLFRVQAAVQYARAFPGEIEAAIEDNGSYDLEKLARLFPQLEVFMVPAEVTDGVTPDTGR